MLNALVELTGRKPIRIVRMTYHIVSFDGTGCLDSESFLRQEASRFEVWARLEVFGIGADVDTESGVVDARARFTAHGGLWAPSRKLEQTLREAVLGRLRVLRI